MPRSESTNSGMEATTRDVVDELVDALQARLDELVERDPSHHQAAEVARLAGMIAGASIARRLLAGCPSFR